MTCMGGNGTEESPQNDHYYILPFVLTEKVKKERQCNR